MIFITNEDKQNLKNKKLTESIILSCLVTCESVISKNAYMEKKWKNYCVLGDQSVGDDYKFIRLEWMGYREKLRALLLPAHDMKEIIKLTKNCNIKASQKDVKEVIALIDTGDYAMM